MIEKIDGIIDELKIKNTHFKKLNYIGNTSLLNKRKISIVGTRRPSAYTQNMTYKLANELSKRDITIVSGAAMGVDAIAHRATIDCNTIAVVANGLDIHYPSTNKKLIETIEQQGLMLSQYKQGERARSYTFVQRNKLVVALGEVLIITEADLNSGSLRSAEFAIKQNKSIYVLPHRLDESLGTWKLIQEGYARPIYDMDAFLATFGVMPTQKDHFLEYCKTQPTYEAALFKYKDLVLEYELEGKIRLNNGIITVV